MYNAIHGLALSYLADFVTPITVNPRCQDLRSSAHLELIPAHYQRVFAEQAFAVAGPMTWNTLPTIVRDAISLTVFRHLLKEHMFKLAFGD